MTVAPFCRPSAPSTPRPRPSPRPGWPAIPADEVETGNSAASGESDVYAVFYVETDPVYAEQSAEIESAQLFDRCGGRMPVDLQPGVLPHGQATATLDDDGNAVFAFSGRRARRDPPTSSPTILAGIHSGYTTTFTIVAPAPTI